jgi:hypothetical protein
MKKAVSVLLAVVLIFSVCPTFSAASDSGSITYEENLAFKLKALGLFKGVSDTDFDLDRAPKRIEAVIMLIRLLGKEDDALNGSWTHPFTDVPAWAGANQYVGYAYQNGLTKGISATEFGSSNAATANMYLTFVLRALGYSDSNNADFSWSNPFTLAATAGVLPDTVDTAIFMRADVVIVSYAALSAKLKDTSTKLSDKLITDGVFTTAAYAAYYDASLIASENGGKELSASEIYTACVPAVFSIVVYDAYGDEMASGSGFFISSGGIAVTNYHVISGCASAKITLSKTGKVYNVTGVYDFDRAEDWAVLKVDGSGFPYLKLGDVSAVSGGNTVYAIGNPLGLQSTISQGIISNPSRTIDNMTYLQTTAAISSGSSGGALLNTYGKVIGITAASIEDPDAVSQNLNLAVPISCITGYSTASCKVFTQLNDDVKVSITASSTGITVGVGITSTVSITITADDAYINDNLAANYVVADENVADAGFAPSWEGDTTTFYITGLKVGTTTIKLGTDVNSAAIILNVTVSGGAAFPCYSGTNVPMYQAVTGMRCLSTIYETDEYSIGYVPSGEMYSYDLDGTKEAAYRNYLTSSGFKLYNTEYYESGIEYTYYKGYYTVYIYVDSDYEEVYIMPY